MGEIIDIEITGVIRLGQFLKLTGLVEDGAQATAAIKAGEVLVNGMAQTQRGKQLAAGDVVELPSFSSQAFRVVGLS